MGWIVDEDRQWISKKRGLWHKLSNVVLFRRLSLIYPLSPFFLFRTLPRLSPPLSLSPPFLRRISFPYKLGKRPTRLFPFSQAPMHALWTHFFLKGPTPRFPESMGRSQESVFPLLPSLLRQVSDPSSRHSHGVAETLTKFFLRCNMKHPYG